MKFHVLASGSKGNATLVQEDNNLLLIDFGVNKCVVVEGLEKLNLKAHIFELNQHEKENKHEKVISTCNLMSSSVI